MLELRNICTQIKDGDWIESKDQSADGIRLIQTGNIGIGTYLDKDNRAKFISEETFNELKCTEVFEGDILISRLPSPVGRACLVPKLDGRAITAVDCTIVSVDRDICIPKYFVYYTMSDKYLNQIDRFVVGTTRARISRKNLEGIKIFLPEISRQKKIVEVLDKTQELIDKRKEQIEALDELVKSRFIEMFGDNNTIFKKWKNTIIDEVSEVGVGVVIKPSEYYTEENNGIKTFRSLNIGEMYVKDKDWVYFTKEGNDKNKKSILKEGQVLIVRSGYPGTACVVTKDYEGCNAIDVIIATPDNKNINSTYMCAFTNFPHGKNQIVSGQAGAGQKHFNVGAYKKLKIALPPIELQNKFEEFVKQVDKLKSQMETSLKELEDNFNSLMQKAFKGELF